MPILTHEFVWYVHDIIFCKWFQQKDQHVLTVTIKKVFCIDIELVFLELQTKID